MLVICCGMKRSGSTLQYQLAVSILERTGKGSGLGDLRNVNCQELHQANTTGEIQVLKVHKISHLKGIEKAFEEGYAVGLYVYRDLRDVAVSLMNLRNLSFDKLMRRREIPDNLRAFEQFTALPNMHISRYEYMVNNLSTEVVKIASHLGIELSEQEAELIAQEYSLTQQKARIESWKKEAGSQNKERNPQTLLHQNHIKSGRCQQWKTALTPLQISYLENLTGKWLVEHKYSLSQPLYLRLISRLVYSRYFWHQKIQRLKHFYVLFRNWYDSVLLRVILNISRLSSR